MKKFTLTLLSLALALSLVLVGCGTTPPTPETTPAPVDEGAPAGEATLPEATPEAGLKYAGRTLNVVTPSDKYTPLFDAFTAATGAKIEYLSMSSGEVISRVQAEGGKPMADLWFGGGIDAFMAAKTDDLLEPYIPQEGDKIPLQYRDEEGYWIAKGITVVGFLANNELLAEKNLPLPTSWAMLAGPEYKGEVIMSDPAISGTNYGAVKGILDLMGEEEGWAYWASLNENIPFYGTRGKDPEEKVTAGEFAVGIIPVDQYSFDVAEKHNLTVVYPEDGIPWVPEGVAIFKNSDGADMGKDFIDFLLLDETQTLLAQLDGKDSAQLVKEGVTGLTLGLPQERLIEEDISTFGSDREAVLERWATLTAGK